MLRNLLANGIPIRELSTILEALGEYASKTKNTDLLTEMVRKHLNRTISEQCKNDNGKIMAITLDAGLEHQMVSSLQQEGDTLSLNLPAETVMDISSRIVYAWKSAADKGVERPVLLCDSRLRYSLAGMLSRAVPLLPVIAYDEVVVGTQVEPVETVSLKPADAQMPRKRELVEA